MQKHLFTTLLVIILGSYPLFARETWNFNPDWCLRIGDDAAASSVSYDDSSWKEGEAPWGGGDDAYNKTVKTPWSGGNVDIWVRRSSTLRK